MLADRLRWPRLRRLPASDASRIVRLTTAAVLAYVVAKAVFPDLTDLTGPLTALLVTQASAFGSLRSGVGRVASVLTGVGVALLLSIWFGLTWWSLGLAIGSALTLGHLLRLGDHVLETPISAMLVLGVTQHDAAAETRIANTLIGAAVGMAFNFALPPSVGTGSAQSAVRRVADETAAAVRHAGQQLARSFDRSRVQRWLDDIHRVLPLVAAADAALVQAQEQRRFNPRARAADDPGPRLRTRLDALDSSVLAVRQTLLAFQEEAPEHEEADDPYGEELRRAFGAMLDQVGETFAAFGELLSAEAGGDESRARELFAHALDALRETRAILTELVLVDPGDSTSTWLLRGSILAGVDRVLAELALERRVPAPGGAPGPGEYAQALTRRLLPRDRRERATPRRPSADDRRP